MGVRKADCSEQLRTSSTRAPWRWHEVKKGDSIFSDIDEKLEPGGIYHIDGEELNKLGGGQLESARPNRSTLHGLAVDGPPQRVRSSFLSDSQMIFSGKIRVRMPAIPPNFHWESI